MFQTTLKLVRLYLIAGLLLPAAQAQDGQDLEMLLEGENSGSQATTEDIEESTEPGTPARSHGLAVEEIVVTAQKREESINDVPISITAFSGDTMKALGVNDTRDLNNLVPGFRYGESGYNTPIYSLRGVGFNEASQTASSTVGVYVNEVNLPFPIMTKGANLDIERVEVLKGPQGTLYGRNTTGGAINYITNKPTEEFEAGINASLGRFYTTDIDGFVSGPLTDTVSGLLALRDQRSQEGWQESITRNDELGEIDKQSARGILEWKTTDTQLWRLTASYWNDQSEPQAPQPIGLQAQNATVPSIFLIDLLPPDFPVIGSDPTLAESVRTHPLIDRDSDDPQAADWTRDLDFQLNDSMLMADVRGEWDFSSNQRLIFLASAAEFESDTSLVPQSGLSVRAGERQFDVLTKAYTSELRIEANSGDITWLGGLFFSSDSVEEVQDIYSDEISTVFPTPAGPVLADRVLFTGEQDGQTLGLFGHMGWHLTERYQLTLGLRYTDEKREFIGCTKDSPDRSQGVGLAAAFVGISLVNGGNGMVPENGCVSMDKQTRNPGEYRGTLNEDNLSGRIALDFALNDDVLLYAALDRGFKSGSFPVLSASEQKQYEPVTQERLHAIELGTKSSLLDGRMQLNAATFYYDYKDKQLLGNLIDPIFGPLPILVNAPESRIIGAELETQYSPYDGLFLSSAISWLDTEITEFVSVNENAEEVDYAGNPFNFAPEIEATFLVNYAWPVGERLEASVGFDASYTDETNSSLGQEPEFHHDDYYLLNARIGLGEYDGRWKTSLWIRNITDELTTISITKPADPFTRYVGLPRTYGLSVNYNWY